MSGSRLNPADRRLDAADQHLGDRLAAFVDGELDHDARERVLAHVATCAKCKAEADAQRRLKSVFAEAAPPSPSESFLARLQGLPGGGDQDDDGSPFGSGGLGTGRAFGNVRGFGNGVFDVDPEPFGYGSTAHAGVLPGPRGFRIHEVGRDRHDSDRASRGRRFAFAAAGAVSLAAIALGGVTAGAPADTADARGAGSGNNSNVTPLRSQAAGSATTPEAQRRRTLSPLLGQSGGALAAPVSPTEASAPLLPGGGHADDADYPFSTPMLSGAARMTPLIRPAAVPAVSVDLAPHASPAATRIDAAPAATPTASSRPSSAR
ncbi:zf-HC2 domain-containing protein [Streptomyces sp. VRA16 Mangrove soil]|uniref:zf-HC2 domain-containing protein n=1 Tax=Streptomyces sp. VRA16 Mangrove soil TaxID=2817434 RepID=UPI001A9DB01A|nr:zf-HC2 domain-containing protein [Streptomyces sp. VRA16 Mangrove soil]MBO1337042.1 zf-HC2 domain-containing protein [Streptomyces sp. VRA16 Mangrove soil]